MISCIKIPTLAYQDMSCNDLARGYDGDRGNLGNAGNAGWPWPMEGSFECPD